MDTEVSGEILRLLRSVNEKLEDERLRRRKDRGRKRSRRESSSEDKNLETSEAQARPNIPPSQTRRLPSPFQWSRFTHRGQDWISSVPLPESDTGSPADDANPAVQVGETDIESYYLVSKYAPEDQTWGYLYESSFKYRAEELSFMSSSASKQTGKAWAIPEDGRSGMTLSLRGLRLERLRQRTLESFEFEGPKLTWDRCETSTPDIRYTVLNSVEQLADFDKRLHKSLHRGFSVTDVDPWNHEQVTYRYRAPITGFFDDDLSHSEFWGDISWTDQDQPVMSTVGGTELKQIFRPLCLPNVASLGKTREDEDVARSVRSNHMPFVFTAPWRRLIFIKGISSISHDESRGVGVPGCPYIDGREDWDRLSKQSIFSVAVRIHLLCQNTAANASNNVYEEAYPFHITFYERLNHAILEDDQSQWRIGELFGEEAGVNRNSKRLLRCSSFTIATISMPSFYYDKCTYFRSLDEQRLDPFYTILLLVPEGFNIGDHPAFTRLLRADTAFRAELGYIILGLGEVITRWVVLEEYLGNLLAEDFMDPKQYSSLLFDDENFTRSRKYFWAIGSLNEFIISIADNIKQWDMYHQARIQPFLDNPAVMKKTKAACLLPAGFTERRLGSFTVGGFMEFNSIQALVKMGVNHRETLANIRSQFESRLDTVKALRDGLFNASALVESRASTRLGENVKLLTYVSIFYLPLAFCASLWAVPNIDEASTRIPLVVTTIIVGLITYATVFNLNSVTRQVGKVYWRGRERLVKDMQMQEGWWGIKGRSFEEFRPRGEGRTPSEWLFLIYACRWLFWRREKARGVETHGEVAMGDEGRKRDVGVDKVEEGSGEIPKCWV